MEEHEKLAMAIMDKLGLSDDQHEKSLGFYCKVAKILPENKLWLLVDKAKAGKNPGALFNHMARKEMG